MNKYNCDIGKLGENLTVDYLKNKNYIIISRNFRFKNKEVDIVAKINDIICFIEVKSRFNSKYGFAMESVTPSKQNNIICVSKYFIHKNDLYDYFIRYDVCEVYFELDNYKHYINYLEDAFRT